MQSTLATLPGKRRKQIISSSKIANKIYFYMKEEAINIMSYIVKNCKIGRFVDRLIPLESVLQPQLANYNQIKDK